MRITKLLVLLGLVLPLVMLSCSEKEEAEENTTEPAEPLPRGETFEVDGIYYNVISKTGVEVTSGELAYSGDIVIPETVTYEGYTYIVREIGQHAFSDCTELTSVELPEGLSNIGWGAFSSCTGLTEVKIPDSVISMSLYAFRYCSSLKNVIIGNKVETIGEGSFYDCTGLADVTIGDNVTVIGRSAFYCCGLEEVIIPDSVTSIEPYAFFNCPSLTKVSLGSNVASIGSYAFVGSQNLREMSLPASVNSIGSWALSGVLDKLYSYNPEPPMSEEDAFEGQQLWLGVLYVPAGSKEAYSTAVGWQRFENIEEME